MTESLESTRLLTQQRIPFRVIELPRPPRSANDIVEMFGCELAQVLKSLLCIGNTTNVIACIPGDRRIDMSKLSQATGNDSIRLASPAEVKLLTGQGIGGLSPFLPTLAHITVVFDAHCLEWDTVNVGAGTPTVGIEISPNDLAKLWPDSFADFSQ